MILYNRYDSCASYSTLNYDGTRKDKKQRSQKANYESHSFQNTRRRSQHFSLASRQTRKNRCSPHVSTHLISAYAEVYGMHPSRTAATKSRMVCVASDVDPYTSKSGEQMRVRHKLTDERIVQLRDAQKRRRQILSQVNLVPPLTSTSTMSARGVAHLTALPIKTGQTFTLLHRNSAESSQPLIRNPTCA